MGNFFAKIGNFFKNQINSGHARKRLIFFVVIIVCILSLWGIPLPTSFTNNQPVSTKIFDRNGKLIYEIYQIKEDLQ